MLGAPAPSPPPLGVKASYPVCKDGSGFKRREGESRAQAAKRQRTTPIKESMENSTALIDAFLERESRPFPTEAPMLNRKAPTNFAGLIPGTKAPASQQQQQNQQQRQQQRSASAVPLAPRGVRTFEDITRQNSSHHALLERPPADWVPPCLARTQLPDAVASVMDPGPAADRMLQPSPTAPLDWSIKTTVRFSSPNPLHLCEIAAAAPTQDVVDAQRSFGACAGTSRLSLQQQLLASLLTWQFPLDPGRQQAAATANSRIAANPSPAMLQRRQAWQAAFSSAYECFRAGRCDALYCLSGEGARRPYVAFFGAAGVNGRPRLHAILTRTTASLRAKLGTMGVGHATPLMPSAAARATEDLAALPVEGTQSMAVFEGGLRVHGLFDFLLNEAFRWQGDEADVPTLLAPTHFLHASLVSVQPRLLGAAAPVVPAGEGPTGRGRGGAAGGLPAGEVQHRMELRGCLPPWVVDRVVAVLAVSQDGTFSASADTHELTLALNWRAGSGSAPGVAYAAGAAAEKQVQGLDDYAARQRGCLDAQEALRWRRPAPGLAGNVVRELRCEAGVFSARLDARSAHRAL